MYYEFCHNCHWVVRVESEEDMVCSHCGASLGGAYYGNRDAPESKVDYLWYLHCGRVTKVDDILNNPKGEWCRCGAGGIGVDLYPWHATSWPRSAHPEYAEVPDVGATYPLY